MAAVAVAIDDEVIFGVWAPYPGLCSLRLNPYRLGGSNVPASSVHGRCNPASMLLLGTTNLDYGHGVVSAKSTLI